MNALNPIRLKVRQAMSQPLVLGADQMVRLENAVLSGRIPHVSVGFFHESPSAEIIFHKVARDRRMAAATADVAAGGISGATARLRSSVSPDLLVVETLADGPGILAALEDLAEVCSPNTKVIVVGRHNDIGLYRQLMDKGISEYLIAPTDSLKVLAAALNLYRDGAIAKAGRISAVVGAKGGVGASTIAQNLAWRVALERCGPVMLADLDLPFGTAALNLDLEPTLGIVEQTMDPERLDEALLERTLIPRGKYLQVLPASARMQEIEFPDIAAIVKLLDLARKMFPITVLDLPHLQSHWMKTVLANADDVVIVAAPDLANLRNTKCMVESFRQSRPNDAPPKLVLNQLGIAKRAGISPSDFSRAVGVDVTAQIDFDPVAFVTAANEGQLVVEKAPHGPAARALSNLAREIDTHGVSDGVRAQRKRYWFQRPWCSRQ